jgi:hypothetical protein
VEVPADLAFELDLIRVRLDMLAQRRLIGLSDAEQAEYQRLSVRETQILEERSQQVSVAERSWWDVADF